MRVSVDRLEGYVAETLHEPLQLQPWVGESALPAFLRGRYTFHQGRLLDSDVLFLFSRGEQTPGERAKHLAAVQTFWLGPIALVFDRVSAKARQRLVRAGIPFVVPGNQMYLPMLALDLRDRFKPSAPERTRRLSPSAQAVFLRSLSGDSDEVSTPTRLAPLLGYTAMTMGRALDQLEAADLVDVDGNRRERRFRLAGEPRDLWEKAQTVLVSPVKRRLWVADDSQEPAGRGLVSGLSALAMYSSLAEPSCPVYALPTGRLDENPVCADEADREVEIWSYSPALFSDGPAVDRLSLYLSLRDDEDERVRSALDEMMRSVTW